jgi:putative transcriptional regulator
MELDKKQLLKKFGKHVKIIRTKHQLTQKELALEIGKDTQAIERLERGGTNPTFYFLYQISVGLNIPLKELVDMNTDDE